MQQEASWHGRPVWLTFPQGSKDSGVGEAELSAAPMRAVVPGRGSDQGASGSRNPTHLGTAARKDEEGMVKPA